MPETTHTEPAAGHLLAALDRLQGALRGEGRIIDDEATRALCWAALDAAGIQPAWRDAVDAAGGPCAVLARGALSSFSSPQRRTRILAHDAIAARLASLRPWLVGGGRVVVGDELARFERHPVCCFYGFGAGRVPAPRARGGAPVVGIVGSRQADLSWCLRTERLAAALARAGVVVVSGGAPGIDRAAQSAARAAGGDVVIVQGSVSRAPADVVVDAGLCWLSPYGPWRVPARHLFAERNAWIAACADVVVVVCGAGRSGTRHTVDAALTLRRAVVTLAARADDPLGVIPRRLAARGAPVIDDEAPDIEALLATPWWGEGLSLPGFGAAAASLEAAVQATCEGTHDHAVPGGGTEAFARSDDDNPPSSPLVRLLRRSGPLLLDDAAARLCTPVRELLADVALLELDGVVRREGALLHVLR